MKTFEEHLVAESAGWVDDGLISETTRTALLARHPAAARGAGRMLAVFASVGGALLLVGISLIIKANWEQIGSWLKIGGLVALLVAAYVGGWQLKMSPGRYPRTGDACLMAGSVLFLLGIALVSQIFHLNNRPANGVLLWWVGIAAIPWLTRAWGAYFVSIMAGLIWLGMEFGADDSWLQLSSSTAQYHNDGFLFAAAGVLLGAALLASGLAMRHTRFPEFAGLHEKLGLGLACFSLYSLGFTWQLHEWSRHTMEGSRWQPVLLLVGLVLGTVGMVWKKQDRALSLLAWLVPGMVPALAHLFGIELGDSGWLWGGIACVSLFIFNFGMIRAGLETGRESWINLGIIGIALNVLTRYFLLFGTMLEGGFFFIVSGLLVIGLGYGLERKRRALVKSVRQEVVS